MLRRFSDLISGAPRSANAPTWEVALNDAAAVSLDAARADREAARRKEMETYQTNRTAETRMRLASRPLPKLPEGAIWAQRGSAWHYAADHPNLISPESGTEITSGVTLFHDCPLSDMLLRQSLAAEEAPAPYTLTLDTLRFSGSFLSLVVAMPRAEAESIALTDIIRLDVRVKLNGASKLYGRLNLQQGPNTAQLLSELPTPEGTGVLETQTDFDLAYGELTDSPIQRAWVDLMVERPAMLRMDIEDLLLSRRPRADL